MLILKPTKQGAGVSLFGDTLDLAALHETIHFLTNDNPSLSYAMREFILGLAFDVRKAKEGQRDTLVVQGGELGEKTTYRGANVLWPIFLIQLAALRQAAAFLPTTRQHQSVLFNLEYATELALLQVDPAVGKKCFEWCASYIQFGKDYLLSFVSETALDYIESATTAKSRMKNLPRLLEQTSEMSASYKKYEMQLMKLAKEQNCSPHDLIDFSQWPDFKW